MKRRAWLSAVALSAGLLSAGAAFAGEITGKVLLNGPAPAPKEAVGAKNDPNCGKLHKAPLMDETIVVGKGGELANVIVYLKGELQGAVPADEVILDQVGCAYVPHVVSVMKGQKFAALNSDPFLHNVHSLSDFSPVNKAQPVKGQKDAIPAKAAEFFKIKCDVHPWMSAWVGVFDHPFHSVTGEDGVYSIDTTGLKDGEYELEIWHEKYKVAGTQKVTVKDGKASADFKVEQKAAAAPAAKEVEVKFASTVGKDATTAAKPCCSEEGGACETNAVASDKGTDKAATVAAK